MLGTTLDAAIGIVLVFLLFSILLTIVMEIIAAWLNLRAKALENTIAGLIETTTANTQFWSGLIGLFRQDKAQSFTAQSAAKPGAAPAAPTLKYEDVFNHPLVAGLSGKDRPSYVPAANFAAALLQQLVKSTPTPTIADVETAIKALTNADLQKALGSLLASAGGDLKAFQQGVETWYDGAMDRLSGDYKRFTQVVTFAVGLLLAIVFNVDAVHVAQRVFAEPTLRTSLVAAAAQQVAPPAAGSTGDLTASLVRAGDAEQALAKIAPVGWSDGAPGDLWLAGLGWLLTALAGLLGAPFWFDTLKGLVTIRGAGPKPTSSTSTSK